MKKRFIAIAVLLSTAAYILPFVIASASSDPTSTSASAAGQTLLQPVPKAFSLRITAYASVPDETDNTPFITANGSYVHDGIVATNLLPFGTKITIPSLFGDKVFVVEDRMAPFFKNSVDIWMPSVGKALYFGVHYAQVVIVPQSPSLTENVTTTASTTLAIVLK